MTRYPFDFSELMKMFDPTNMSKMFDPDRFRANLASFSLPYFDFDAVIERNKKNIEVIQEANKASAEAFRDIYAMQMTIFNELTRAAQHSVESLSRESGKDLVAKRIREVAAEHKVPIFSAPPLARALFRSTDIGDEIPAKLYAAVAQVLAYIFQLNDTLKPGQRPMAPPVPVVNEDEFPDPMKKR